MKKLSWNACCCANMKKKVTALEADAIFIGKTRILTHQALLPARDVIKSRSKPDWFRKMSVIQDKSHVRRVRRKELSTKSFYSDLLTIAWPETSLWELKLGTCEFKYDIGWERKEIRWVLGVIAYITLKVGKQYRNSIHGNSQNYFELFLITIVRKWWRSVCQLQHQCFSAQC